MSDSNFNQHYNELDKLLEHRSRFAICALLSRHKKVSFSRFKELLKESDGNLGAQLRKLEDAGYIEVEKTFAERRPISWYCISTTGKKAIAEHLAALQTMLNQTD